MHGRNFSLTAVDVRPSSLSGVRKIVDVIFSYSQRGTDFTEKFFVRGDVAEEFPFLVSKLSPYLNRGYSGGEQPIVSRISLGGAGPGIRWLKCLGLLVGILLRGWILGGWPRRLVLGLYHLETMRILHLAVLAGVTSGRCKHA